ncbi:PLP-dependent transferase [Micromonospora matsumotoense]|uniref:PLP-dependent transferase n=1 Tax=Micromonospora matsumotoense TaxID=121616 RepID=UPI003D8C3814
MSGHGRVFSLDLAGGQPAAALPAELRLAKRAASLGSVSTLVVHPRSMWAGIVDADQLADAGIGEGLVRVSTGIEEIPDLVADFTRALDLVAGWLRPIVRASASGGSPAPWPLRRDIQTPTGAGGQRGI